VLRTAVNQQKARRGGIGPANASRANRSEVSLFIRRITDGIIARIQGKARGAGELRVALFPSKHSRVRIPSPALEAEYRAVRPPTRRPTSKVNPFFGGSGRTLWPVRLPQSDSPKCSMPQRTAVSRQAVDSSSRPGTRQLCQAQHTTADSISWCRRPNIILGTRRCSRFPSLRPGQARPGPAT